MPNTSHTQQRLAQDLTFQGRVRAALATVAWQVLNEPATTANHDKRAAYARSMIGNLTFGAQTQASWLVERPNLRAFDTTYDFESGNIVTAATDADIESQLATDWDVLSSTAGGGPAAV